MPDTKITALTAISTVDPAVDVLPIVDVSDTTMAASGTTKKITSNQILGAGGTATLASATITGDLTVDTNVLKVDSSNNRVGIGTATPGYDLEVAGSVRSNIAIRGNFAGGTDIAHLRFVNANGSIVGDIFSQNTNGGASDTAYLSFQTASSGTLAERYRIAGDGVATWSNVGGVAGTAMTLNSTGLGVGGSPSSRLDVANSGTPVVFSMTLTGAQRWQQIIDTSVGNWTLRDQTGSKDVLICTAGSGNVGVGVTPSYKLDVSTGGVLTTTARLVGNDQSNVRLRFENTGASGRIWELVGGLAGSNNRWFSLRDVTGSTTPWGVDDSMNVISNVTGTAPTLSTNSQMVFNLTSNTNLRISVRGTDGTTRTANITLA
jgi:hypothetical protein